MAETGLYYFRLALQEENARRERKLNPGLKRTPQPKPAPERKLNPERKPTPERKPLATQPPHRVAIPATCARQPPAPSDDYTGSVCLLHTLTDLFPIYEEVLVDADDFDRLTAWKWHLVRCRRESGLRVFNAKGRYLHTVVMDAPKGMVVDHIYHRTLDNRKSQLRVCTTRDNNVNRRPRGGKASRFKGVYRSERTGKWFVHAGPRGGRVYIGGFDSEAEAAQAYNDLARQLYGSMAYQNSVEITP